MPQSETAISILTGISKIVQDFIKILYTYQDENGYGTKIVDYAGQVVVDSNQTCSEIASIIYNATEYYKDLQMSAILDGNNLSDDEILDQAIIDVIEYEEDTGSIYIEIVLYSRSGVQSELGVEI
jgi:hypothetical protein